MPHPSNEAGDSRQAILPAIVIFLFGLVVRLWLIHRYPPVFGGDATLRLAYSDLIVLLHHLPLMQAIVHYIYAIQPDPMLVRYAVSLIGAAAGVGFYLVVSQLVPRAEAFLGTLLFVACPLILPLSTVPYNDILMVAGMLGAIHGVVNQRWLLASASLGAACLGRYESWLLCPVIAAVYLRSVGGSVSSVMKAAALFGWAPLAWIVHNGGHITPPGTMGADGAVTFERFFRWLYVGYKTLRFTPVPVVFLALLGAWQVARRRLWENPACQILAAFLGLFMVALLFSAHGTPPNPERFVVPREAHLPLVCMLVLATLGLTALPRLQGAVVLAGVLTGLWMSERYVAEALAEPQVALAVEVADYLRVSVVPPEHVTVLAKPVSFGGYLDRLEHEGGEAGRDAGVALARHLQVAPFEFQMIAVQSRLGKARVHSYSSLIVSHAGQPDTIVTRPMPDHAMTWIVVWSNFSPTSEFEQILKDSVGSRSPVYTAKRDTIAVSVFRIR